MPSLSALPFLLIYAAVPDQPEARVLEALVAREPAVAGADLETTSDRLAGGPSRHVRFRQRIGGLPVLDREASVHLNGDAVVLVRPLDPLAPPAEPGDEPVVDRDAAVEIAGRAAAVRSLRAAPIAELGYVADESGRRARLVWRIDVPARKPLGDFRAEIDARTGEILPPGLRDRLRRADGTGRVFDPNPVATSGDITLEDGGDLDTPLLTAQLLSRPLRLLDASGFLRGFYCDTRNTRGRAFEPTLSFLYTRSDPRFEEVMLYHHITETQLYLQSILGATRVVDRSIIAEAHGTDEDQSFFSPATGRLTFGDGGVDGAEDAEVIFHEYAHAIEEAIVPGIGTAGESEALLEGFSDFFSASISASPGRTAFGATCVADWDAVTFSGGTPPCLRRLPSLRRYPDDIVGQRHEDGQIFSSALWRLREAIGRDEATRLAIEAHFYLSPASGFLDAAYALFLADTALNARANHAAIAAAMDEHGLLPVNFSLAGNVNAGLPAASFSSDGESGGGAFTTESPTGNGDFALVADPLAPSATHAWRTTGLAVVKEDRLVLPARVLPAAPAVLRFSHRYDLEPRYDGAVLEYSVAAGPWLDAEPLFSDESAYERTILAGSSGPLAGRRAWSGKLPSYATVAVDLAGLEGLSVSFRWRLGCDASIASPGWFIDDVSIRPAGGGEREDVLFLNAGPPAFEDDLESGAPLFAATLAEGTTTFALVESPLATSPTHVFLCPTEDGRQDATLTLGPVDLPVQPTSLVFRQRFALETGYDGARLFLRTVPGGTVVDLEKKLRKGAYSGGLLPENPMGGGDAWTGSSGPGMSEVEADLGDWAGTTVEILFRLAADDTVGGGGWIVDDVSFGANPGTGGAARHVRIREGDPFRLEIAEPSGGPAAARFAVYVWNTAPAVDAASAMPFDVGALALPILFHGGSPQPAIVLSNAGKPAILGVPDVVPPPAPTALFDLPSSPLPPGTYTVQGLVLDRNAVGQKKASVTNGIVIEVLP